MRTMLGTNAGLFVTISSGILALGAGSLAYLAFLHNPSPVISYKWVAVEATGIGSTARLYLTGEVCVSRDSEAEVYRILTRLPDEGHPTPEISEVPVVHADFRKGCQTRTRRLDMPEDMPEGVYSLRAGLRWCGGLGNCATDWFSPVQIRLQMLPGGMRITVRTD